MGKRYRRGQRLLVTHGSVRDKAIHGTDADAWRPERWLEEGAEVLERFSFTFGFGGRVCLGRDIALMEIYKGAMAVSTPQG